MTGRLWKIVASNNTYLRPPEQAKSKGEESFQTNLARTVATSDLKMDPLLCTACSFVIHLKGKRQCVAPVSKMGGKMPSSSGHSV